MSAHANSRGPRSCSQPTTRANTPATTLQPERLEDRRLFATYSVIDLGTLGGTSSFAFDVNSRNQVVGYAATANGVERAFRFADANNNGKADPGEMEDLGALAGPGGGPHSVAYGINDAGQVVGTSRTAPVGANGVEQAVRFEGGGVVTDLNLGPGSNAYAITFGGTLVGGATDAAGYRAFVRTPNGAVDRFTLPAASGFAAYAEARAINDSGVITGFSGGSAGDSAFRRLPDGSIKPIGFANQPANSRYGYGWDVNASGDVAGEGFTDTGSYRAFRCDGAITTDLGVLNGYFASEGYGINAAGAVVGQCEPITVPPGTNGNRAFLYTGGVMQNLNALIPANSGWILNEARAINDAGYIVGSGQSPSGQTHAFLLAPVGPQVTSIGVNDGAAQRSKVRSITVTFDVSVVPDEGAFVLIGRNGAGVGTTVTASSPLDRPGPDSPIWILTFSGNPVIGGSLADGVYDLTVVAAKIHEGTSAGATMGADRTLTFHRLFSDADGDGDSDNADLFMMRSTYGKLRADPAYKWYFDYEDDGDVDNADLLQVRGRRTTVFQGY